MDSVRQTLRQKRVVSEMKILQRTDCLFRMQSRVLLATLKPNVLEYALKKIWFQFKTFQHSFSCSKSSFVGAAAAPGITKIN